MQIANVHEAKTHLSKLLERVLEGEEIVIARAGKPVAKLVAYHPDRQPRRGGRWHGKVRMAADFDQLPAEVAAAFRGERP